LHTRGKGLYIDAAAYVVMELCTRIGVGILMLFIAQQISDFVVASIAIATNIIMPWSLLGAIIRLTLLCVALRPAVAVVIGLRAPWLRLCLGVNHDWRALIQLLPIRILLRGRGAFAFAIEI
jgi:hypothetical protein